MACHTHQPGPLACNLGGMSAEERQRYASLNAQMRGSVQQLDEVDGGYRIGFAPENEHIQRLAEFVTLERLCCPFLNMAIELDAARGQLWLRLTGPEGTKEFLTHELQLKRETA